MNQSESIKELAAALTLAQAELKPAVKDATNPHLKSKYANLASVWEAVKEPLAKNGLSVVQTFAPSESGTVTVVSTLLHKSGEWIASPLTLPVGQATAQGYGSAITYGRRYGLSALLGVIADDDDDGAQASHPPQRQNGYEDRTRDAPGGYDARPAAPNGNGIWDGPGQCPRCHCPEGKRHGKPCV
jgi:hypothetical protein